HLRTGGAVRGVERSVSEHGFSRATRKGGTVHAGLAPSVLLPERLRREQSGAGCPFGGSPECCGRPLSRLVAAPAQSWVPERLRELRLRRRAPAYIAGNRALLYGSSKVTGGDPACQNSRRRTRAVSRAASRGSPPTLGDLLLQRQDPGDEILDVRVGDLRVWRHRNLTPDPDTALLDLVGEFCRRGGIALVLRRNFLVRGS